ncbi:MAG: hypothetical protein CMQ05_13140 [Gammaproteobacteria bacterium]|nr:hypothetical protein [Gammaproteobacteria bacterium]RPG25300.1 MAG: hypothetical protein CBC10_009360 [Gammaproteobacteria bacterium TMED50]
MVDIARVQRLGEYWRFFWPLVLMGAVLVLSGQFQNGILARYPDAVRELAVFAIAGSTFGLFHAGISFVSQMANVYARSEAGTRQALRFVIVICVVLSSLIALLAFTTVGTWLMRFIYGINDDLLHQVMRYMQLYIPLIVVDGIRQFLMGLLVQARMTGRLTIVNMMQLSVVIASLIAGFSSGMDAPIVLVGSMILGSGCHLMLLVWLVRKDYTLPEHREHESLSFGELFRFFLPVATTGVMFAISRPVLYALIARSPDAVVSIAAMRVGFDVASLFQVTANQFRHFFVTFGDDDLPLKRQFMWLVGGGITVSMLLVAATPVSHFLLSDLIGIQGTVLTYSREVLLWMCFLPGLILWRNYYHGLLMVARRTTGMALGGIVRVGGIYLLAQSAWLLGWLDFRVATIILLMGFVFEATVVTVICRWHRRRMGKA